MRQDCPRGRARACRPSHVAFRQLPAVLHAYFGLTYLPLFLVTGPPLRLSSTKAIGILANHTASEQLPPLVYAFCDRPIWGTAPDTYLLHCETLMYVDDHEGAQCT